MKLQQLTIPGLALLVLGACTPNQPPSTSAATQFRAAEECVIGIEPACSFEWSPVGLSEALVLQDDEPFAFYRTVSALQFSDRNGSRWNAPQSTLTDGASIPQIFIPLIGDPLDPQFVNAAAVHDAYCGVGNEGLSVFQSRNWEDVHRMFYDALISSGVNPVKAKIMFAGVYLGGPRWNDPSRNLSAVSDARLVQEMEWCIRWIKRMNPSRERIIRWMEDREAVLTSADHTEPNFDALFSEG